MQPAHQPNTPETREGAGAGGWDAPERVSFCLHIVRILGVTLKHRTSPGFCNVITGSKKRLLLARNATPYFHRTALRYADQTLL